MAARDRRVGVCRTGLPRLKHGGAQTRLYKVWVGMRRRCFNPEYPKFEDYGARGITICPAWEDFAVFRMWALSHDYKEGLTIERRDNNGNYSPENCSWIPGNMQQRNRRMNRFVTAFGETKTLAEWVRDPRCLVGWGGLKKRLALGVPPEQALMREAYGV